MAKIPLVYKSIEPLILGMLNGNALTHEKIKKLLITEWDWKHRASQKPKSQTKLMNHIFAIKQKGVTPTFYQQQQPSKASSSHQRTDSQGLQQEWKQHSKHRSIKNKKKGKKTDPKGKSKHCAHFTKAKSSDSNH